MKVWVAVADYGLNGANVLRVYLAEPTQKEVDQLEHEPVSEGAPYTHRDVTGFGGVHIEEIEAS